MFHSGLLDTGPLAPVRAGAEAAVVADDAAWLRAMLDAEAALVRAQATLGDAPADAAAVSTEVAKTSEFDIAELALGAANTGCLPFH